MGMLAYINQYVGLFLDTLRQVGRGKVWLVLLILAVLQAIILYALHDFLSPLFYGIVMWFVRLVAESDARLFIHYPTHYLVLPHVFGLAKLVPGLVAEGLLLGAAAMYFHNAYLKDTGAERLTFRSAAASWLQLILAWLLLNGLTMLISLYLPDWLVFFHDFSPRRLALLQWAVMPFIFTVVLAMLFFTIPAVVIQRLNILRAVVASLRVFIRRPLTCLFLAAAILVGPYVLSQFAGYSSDIIVKFRPELVFWVLMAGLAVELVANFFWMGTAVRFMLSEDELS